MGGASEDRPTRNMTGVWTPIYIQEDMPLDEGKLKRLYDTLQEGGYSQDYDTFKKGFTGNEHYENRKKVYDLLTENGAQIGSTYEEFMQKMQKPRAQVSAGNDGAGVAKPLVTVNSAPADGDVGAKPAVAPSVKKSSPAAPHGAPLSEQDRIRMGAAAWQLGQNAVKGVKATNARVGRLADSVTLKGKKRERLGEFRARVSGTPTTVAGAPTVSLTGNGGGAVDSHVQKDGGTKSAESPKPYGVVYENGKAKTQWLLPDGSLTTSLLDANNAEYAARTERLARAFHDRMRENGLDPENADDVEKQSQLDYEAPLRKAVEDEWQRAEAEDSAADEQYRKDYEKSRHGGFLDMAKEALTTAFDAGGHPHQSSADYQRDLARRVQRRETFDLGKMAESVYKNMPQPYRESRILAYSDYFRKHPQELKGRSVAQAAADALRGEAYRATYERAVKANMPKSKTEFFLRKVADQPLLSQSMATDLAASALTGSYGMSQAEADAMGRYGKEHRALDIAGTVANMAVDPVTYLSGGVGGVLGKKALQVAGKSMLKGATKDVAERYAGRTLAGRLVAGAAGGAGNFGTFETVKNIENQMRMGGSVDEETGERGFSGSEVLKSTLRGTLLGSVTGALSPLIGNVADKLVKSASSVVGKAGVRAGELAASTVAEGTVFATPEWIENASMADDDPNKRSAMDVWTDNMAMMLGFKASHAVKSAPRVIAGLRPIAEPKTMEEREHNRRSFMELLRDRLEASPSDMDFTSDERRELEGRGYGDLAKLFSRMPEGDAGVKTPAHEDSGSSGGKGTVEGLGGLEAGATAEKAAGKDGTVDGLGAGAEGRGIVRYDGGAERAVASRAEHPEFDGYSSMESLMQDKGVSQSTRAKAYYILTGRQLPMGTVTGYTTEEADGGITVQAVTMDGEVVTSRRFADKEAAQQEMDKIQRQAELNAVDVGERYKDMAANVAVFEAAVEHVAPGVDMETVMRNYKAVKDGDADAVRNYGEMVEEIDKAIEANRGMADAERPEGIRAAIKEETGVEVDAALKKTAERRSEAERAAVEEYLKRLYPEQEGKKTDDGETADADAYAADKAEAEAGYDRSRLLWGKVEQGDMDAKADMDAISLRMREAYQMCEEAFGEDAEVRMAEMQDDPWGMVTNPELTVDQQDAVLYYIKAKAAMDGVLDASNDAMENRRREVAANVERHTHKDSGMVQPGTMKVDGRAVYIVKGNVALFPDGSGIDAAESDQSIVVCDAETGEYKFVSPDQIGTVGESVDPQMELDEAYARIQAEQEEMLGSGGEDAGVSTPAHKDSGSSGGKGTVEGLEGLGGLEKGATAEKAAGKDGTVEGLEGLGGLEKGATAEKAAGKDGTVDDLEGLGELEAGAEGKEGTGSAANGTENATNGTENATNGTENAANGTENAANGTGNALARVPVDEKTGEPLFERVDAETALDALGEVTGGNAENTSAIVGAQLEQATKALETLKKKAPKRKKVELKGTPMQMVKAQQEADAAYNAAMEEYEAQVGAAEESLKAWSGVSSLMNDRKRAKREREEAERREREERMKAEGVALAETERRLAAEKAAEQSAVGSHAVNPKLKAKWDGAPKVEGNANAITLEDGSVLRGRYVLTEAGAATASHDVKNAYEPTEGFPVDENGESVNDRDYRRDVDAQRIVREMAEGYDGRALQSPVIVSRDGIVLSGNNRTMSGDLAAERGTDKAYTDHLREYGRMYGFTPEQIGSMKHPRVVFVPDEELPYDAKTFARFNAESQKKQSKPEQAVKLGKVVPDGVFERIAGDIARYDRLSDYYADEKAVAGAMNLLRDAGVINDMQLPELRTGSQLSAAGKELIENTLIGKVFQTSPDAVRQIIAHPTLRQSVVTGLNEIAHNRMLAESGYDLSDELAAAIDLVSRAKSDDPDAYKEGRAVSPYGRQAGLFDDENGDSRVTDGITLLLADLLNSGRPAELRRILSVYNEMAQDPAGGQLDMFSGGLTTKEEILNAINETLGNATRKEQKALVDAAVAGRKSRANAAGGGETENAAGSGKGDENKEGIGGVQEFGERQSDLQTEEEVTAKLSSDKTDEYGKPLVLAKDGTTTFGMMDAESGLKDAPIQLSLGENRVGDDGKNHGYGLLHIEAGHGEQIRDAGFSSVEEFVEEVAKNYVDIREGAKIGDKQTYLLEMTDGHNNTLFVQLSKDGTYWNVNSAGIFNVKYSRRKPKVYSVPALGEDTNTDTSEVNSGHSDGVTAPAGNSSKTSVHKVIKNDSDLQEKAGKSSVGEGKKSLAARIESASAGVDTEPSEAQKEAGNYRKGHVHVGTFDITIEQPEGSVRRGTDADGKRWESKMHNTYGYFRGTEGVDGDHIDVFLSNDIDGWNGRRVFVVDQYNPDGTFDEHKVMLGFNDMDEAKSDYLANYKKGWEDGRRIDVSGVNLEDFEKWIASSHRKTKPFSEYTSVSKETSVRGVVPGVETPGHEDSGENVRLDGQGNPVNADGTLKVEKVHSVDELTDEDFSHPYRNVELPRIPENVDKAIGANGKPVVIKRNIFEKNQKTHKFPFDESRSILGTALYETDLIGRTQPTKRPLHWVAIKLDAKSPLVVIEVSEKKENVEIVGWYTLDERNLERIKRQAEKNGGELVMLSRWDKVESLSTPLKGLSSDGKDTDNSSDLQEKTGKSSVEEEKKPHVDAGVQTSGHKDSDEIVRMDGQGNPVNADGSDDGNEYKRRIGVQEKPQNDVEAQTMSHDEAIAFIAEMENRADVAPFIELTIDNWNALFGKDGIVKTPIGDVKMGDNQFSKMLREDRSTKLGMVKPTLETPDVILEDASKAKNGDEEERPSSYIFIKAFLKSDGSRYYYFTSVTVSKDGREVVISNQEKRKNAIANLLSKDKLVWKHADDVSDASDVAQGLYSSQGKVSDLATEGTDAPQTDVISDDKGNEFSSDLQETTEKSSVVEEKKPHMDAGVKTSGHEDSGYEDIFQKAERIAKEDKAKREKARATAGVETKESVGRLLTKEEADVLLSRMENDAEVSTEKELTAETWNETFDENNSIETPVGRVKMGENQIAKFLAKNRAKEFGMVGPTLSNPDVIIEEKSEAKDGDTERPSSFLFVKTFNRNGEKIKFFASITVKRDGLEVSVSSHYLNRNKVSRAMQEGKVLYIREALLPNSSEWRLAEHQENDVPDLLPTQGSDASKEEVYSRHTTAKQSAETVETTQDAEQSGTRTSFSMNFPTTSVGKVTRKKSNSQKNGKKKVEPQQMVGDLFAGLMDEEPETNNDKNKDNGLQRNDETVRSRGVSADSGRQQQGLSGREGEAEKEKKYAEMDASVEAATGVAADDEDADGENMFRDGDDDGMVDNELDRVNERFNEQVVKLTEENADKTVLSLGRPSAVLRSAGVMDKPMKLYGNKVMKKMRKHGFALEELRDLPKAVANPVAVFDNYGREGNRSILTELKTRNGNFLVTLNTGKGEDVDFNIVSSVFGKGGENIVDWLVRGLATYINKEKALNYLHHSALLAEALSSPRLLSAAKLIENFENPKLSDKNFAGNDDGEKFRLLKENDDPKEAMENEMATRVEELSKKLGTPVRIIRTDEEVAALPTPRQRRMKGSFNSLTGEVTVVVPNNANLADIENTFMHEVVGHDGLRVLFPEEEKLNNALDELYRVSNDSIKHTIDRMAQKMYDAEVDRLREQKRKAHEAKGEDADAAYYADMAEVHAEAGKKRDQFRHEATEEYGADLAGRIGDKGFDKMSADEQTFWGRLKAMLQKALERLLSGLKIPGKRKWGDKEWSFVLHEAYKRKKNGGRPTVFDAADTEVMRRKTGYEEGMANGDAVKKERNEELNSVNERFNEEVVKLTEENADKTVLSLGRPSAVLRSAGVKDKPMKLYGNKVMKKMRKHGFALEELRDLPKAVANPITVFNNYQREGNRSIVTELETKDGNFLVTLELGKDGDIDFNIVSSVFGKGFNNMVDWYNKGYATYIDKEKALSFLYHQSAPIAATAANAGQTSSASLSSASQPVQQEIDKQVLDDAAKIVKNFENPKFSDENVAENEEGMMYNDGDTLRKVMAITDMKQKVADLFEKAHTGEFKGKPQSICRLSKEGKAYLEKLSGLQFKEYVDFVLNPSDLNHIRADHYGEHEKDMGNNVPLTDEDIQNMVDVLNQPDGILYGVDKNDGRKLFFFLKDAGNGLYNLTEVCSTKKGNLTAKSFFKSKKKGIDQRVMEIKQSLLPTSVTYSGEFLSSDAKIPTLFENAKFSGEKVVGNEGILFRDDALGEMIERMKSAAASANGTNRDAKQKAMYEIGGNLSKLRQAMARQREYDKTTVKSITDLARIMMEGGLLGDLSRYDVKRILSTVDNAHGREDVSGQGSPDIVRGKRYPKYQRNIAYFS